MGNVNKLMLFCMAVMALGAVLYLTQLGNIYLWQDEAQTALIARTVLDEGVPKGTDGKNFFSQELGAEYGEDYTYKWHTWLPFYVVAASFKLFGESTFTARLPFALFGLGCVMLTFVLTRKLFQGDRPAIFATCVLLFSIPFVILSRQCRYYSMAAFFALLTSYGYQKMVRCEKHGAWVFFLGATLLFHTHYVYVATLVAAFTLHLLVFHRHIWKKFLITTLLVLVFNAPWILWLSSMKYGEQYGASLFAFEATITRLSAFGSDIFKYVFTPYLLVVPVVAWAVGWFRDKPGARMADGTVAGVFLPLLVIGSTVMALSLSAPAPFFRYLAPLIPFFAIVTGLILSMAHGVHRSLGVLLLAVLIVFSPIDRFLYEITHDYDGPIEGIVNYLNNHAGSDDVVAITYGDMPLKFYTGLRVIGGLTGEDMAPAADADWVIIRNHVISNKDFQVRKWLTENLDPRGYERITLDYPDSPFENRESPSEHMFRTATDYVPVVLFRKKSPRPGGDSATP